MPVLLKVLHKIETERISQHSFYDAIVTQIPKPHKYPGKKEFQANLPHEHRCKKIKYLKTEFKNISKRSSTTYHQICRDGLLYENQKM